MINRQIDTKLMINLHCQLDWLERRELMKDMCGLSGWNMGPDLWTVSGLLSLSDFSRALCFPDAMSLIAFFYYALLPSYYCLGVIQLWTEISEAMNQNESLLMQIMDIHYFVLVIKS